MLQLHVPDLQPGDGLLDLLDRLKDTRIAVSLTVPSAILDISAAALLDCGLKELLLSAGCPDDLVGGIGVLSTISSQTTLGISFVVARDNWRQLPRLVAFCRKEGIKRLVLPMQRLYHRETPFFITRVEQQELADSLAESGAAEGLNLTIHDPFLWRAFNPGIPFPQAGCQAANTMIAIAPDGGVYPCPTLPVLLGSIGEMPLQEIISSPAKKEFRRSLLKAPGTCCDCAEIAVCRGGCRGRGLVQQGSLDGLDEACR
jgi:GeoRSP system SPASM domain protein